MVVDSIGNDVVVAGEGTGLVHIAPGCGAIDNKIGKKIGIVEIAPLNDEAKYDGKEKKCICPPGTFYNTSDQCQKDIGTLNVFVNTPIANCIVVALMSFLFAGFFN